MISDDQLKAEVGRIHREPIENTCARELLHHSLRNRARQLHEEAIQLDKLADFVQGLPRELEQLLYEPISRGLYR